MSYADKVIIWIIVLAIVGSLLGISVRMLFGRRAANENRR